MERPNEYNYKRLGMKKFVIEYEINGHTLRSKEFAFDEAMAKRIIRNAHRLVRIVYKDIHEC